MQNSLSFSFLISVALFVSSEMQESKRAAVGEGAGNVRGFIMLILCAVAAFLIIKKTFINH